MSVLMSDRVLQLSNELRHAREEMARYGELLETIQKSILPRQLPSVPGLDLAVHFAEAETVGGNFYDVHPIPLGRWSIVVADVIGQGLAAAGILVLAHALGSVVQGQEAAPSPGAALAWINHLLATRYLPNTGQLLAAFLSLYDAGPQMLTYASAGHPPPRLVRGNEVHRLDEVSGLPLGIDQASVYQEHVVRLLPGDRLVLFTDGITESTNAAHDIFGDDHLDETIRTPASTATELLHNVVAALRRFRAGQPASDDETCLVAVVKPVQQTTQVQ